MKSIFVEFKFIKVTYEPFFIYLSTLGCKIDRAAFEIAWIACVALKHNFQ